MRILTIPLALSVSACAGTSAYVCPTLNLVTEMAAVAVSVPTGYDMGVTELSVTLMTLTPCYEDYEDGEDRENHAAH